MAPLKSFHSDLVVEILAKLPVKSLLRFRCVSKSWDITITDPVFSKLHQTRPCLFISKVENGPFRFTCLSNEALLADSCDGIDGAVTYMSVPWGTNADRSHSLPVVSWSHSFHVVGCCNGLVCVSSMGSTGDLTLWNPSTRKFKTLPPLMSFGDKFSSFYGFGYDEVTDDYKVVKGFVDDVLMDVGDKVFVFSLKSDAWRRIPNSNIGSSVPAYCFGVLLGGALHWEPIFGKPIIAFDLAKEKFEVLPPPETGHSLTRIGVLGEHLYVCSKIVGRGVDVWIMKEYGVKSSWTKMFRVPLETLSRYEYKYEIDYAPLLFSKEDEIVAMVSGTGSAVVRCNTKDMRFKDLMLWPNNRPTYVFLYTESLVSPLVNHQA